MILVIPKQDSAYGTLPLENSDQNTSKDNSFELISSPDGEVAKISQEIEAQGKVHDLVHSQLFGVQKYILNKMKS